MNRRAEIVILKSCLPCDFFLLCPLPPTGNEEGLECVKSQKFWFDELLAKSLEYVVHHVLLGKPDSLAESCRNCEIWRINGVVVYQTEDGIEGVACDVDCDWIVLSSLVAIFRKMSAWNISRKVCEARDKTSVET